MFWLNVFGLIQICQGDWAGKWSVNFFFNQFQLKATWWGLLQMFNVAVWINLFDGTTVIVSVCKNVNKEFWFGLSYYSGKSLLSYGDISYCKLYYCMSLYIHSRDHVNLKSHNDKVELFDMQLSKAQDKILSFLWLTKQPHENKLSQNETLLVLFTKLQNKSSAARIGFYCFQTVVLCARLAFSFVVRILTTTIAMSLCRFVRFPNNLLGIILFMRNGFDWVGPCENFCFWKFFSSAVTCDNAVDILARLSHKMIDSVKAEFHFPTA